MKLFSTHNSPFSRVARIAIQELGLSEEVKIEYVTVRDPNSELLKYGPLGKVPALQMNGELFSDTRIVVAMLESVSTNNRLTASTDNPPSLAFEGFCIGFLESIAVWIREARREPELISEHLLAVEKQRAIRCVEYLSDHSNKLSRELSLASIAVACGLDLAKRRLGFIEFEKYSDLNDWFQLITQRASFQSTEPHPI
ncbi:glutathione S-transferase family protein [Shewanella sedimentimangrovi]|uniref:Glutathione S-transferase N-terminal domain-containing protein n=1 Tax=Shewanella sedimentimangrovi TaxID=2814293 RepID=A0ABX7R4X3_9GAMM|nr:glutathione S-transferase N-terminal domain-containing protein [Shewanella sedimentimangrovi]QSX38230.1 glutathione S-transferase N-terminal domain-containing protein [Shewanella sedimentimangrovi]